MPRIAFVSYSHDSADHKVWVLRLATDIRSSGVDARLDRWHLRPGEEAGPFMSRAVSDSDKVIVVCSESYVAKAGARLGGTGFESALVTAELVANQGTAKFIPVLRGNAAGRIPDFLAGRIYVDFRADDLYEDSLTTLLRAIHDLPALDPPPVGAPLFDGASAPAETTRSAVPTGGYDAPSVEQVEELLQNPHRRIQLSKVLWTAAEAAREQLTAGGFYQTGQQPTPEVIGNKVSLADNATARLAPLLATMGRWATRDQIASASQVVAHLLDIPDPQGSYYEAEIHLARYPALVALYSAGLGALSEGRLDNLRAFLFMGVPSNRSHEQDRALVHALHRGAPFAQEFWKLLPGKDKRHTPVSDHVLERLSQTLPSMLGSANRAERLFDQLESHISLGYLDATLDQNDRGWAPLGSYLWRDPLIVTRMKDDLTRLGPSWPPLLAGFFSGSVDRATTLVGHLTEHLGRVREQRGVF